MKPTLLNLLISFLFIGLSCCDEGTVPLGRPATSPVNQIVLDPCGGNWICLQGSEFSVDYFNPGDQVSFPGAYGAATSYGNSFFFAGGHEEGSIGFVQNNLSVFNPESGYKQFALSIPRSHLSAATADTKVLVAGGCNIHSNNPVHGMAPIEYYNRVDIMDAKDYSIFIGKLSEARAYMASVGVDGKAYFIGGKTIDGFSSKMDIYDAEKNSWTAVDLPRPRAHGAAAVIGNKIYIAGGQNASGHLTTMDVYDYVNAQWSVLNAPHEHPICTVIALDNKIFIAGGDGLKNKSVDIYTTTTDMWSSAELSDSRYYIAATTANNKIIFLGGQLSPTGNFSSLVDTYNVTTNKWSNTKLNDGVSGVAAATAGNSCYFVGLLYQNGNAIPQTLLKLTP